MLMLKSTHEALMAAQALQLELLTAYVEEWRAAFREQSERHNALLDTLAIRVTTPPAAPAPRVTREPDAVDTAIEWVAQGDIPKRRFLERFAKGERRKGRPVAEIADEILHGSKVDPEDDGIPE